jgi:hypothetical protein
MEPVATQDTAAWRFQVMAAFAVALGITTLGVAYLPVDLWTKGFLVMGLYFTVSSSFSLAKTLRDAHESQRLLNKIAEARTEQVLRDYADA